MNQEEPSNSESKGSGPKNGIEPLDWARMSGKEEPVARAVEAFVRRRRRQRKNAAGIAFALVALAALLWRGSHFTPSAEASAHSVMVSTPERRVLPDGSIVDLKENAEIVLDFTPAFRRVVLKRGEAMFEVAKNPARPVLAVAGNIEVRAVGTAFCVDFQNSAVDVLVTEGTVAVRQTDQPVAHRNGSEAAPLALVGAGRQLTVDLSVSSPAAPRVQSVPAEKISDLLSWRVPRLEFNSTRLGEIATAVDRYSHVKLVLADPELQQLQLSGVLRADNIGVLLEILSSSYHVEAERRGENEIVLHQGPKSHR